MEFEAMTVDKKAGKGKSEIIYLTLDAEAEDKLNAYLKNQKLKSIQEADERNSIENRRKEAEVIEATNKEFAIRYNNALDSLKRRESNVTKQESELKYATEQFLSSKKRETELQTQRRIESGDSFNLTQDQFAAVVGQGNEFCNIMAESTSGRARTYWIEMRDTYTETTQQEYKRKLDIHNTKQTAIADAARDSGDLRAEKRLRATIIPYEKFSLVFANVHLATEEG